MTDRLTILEGDCRETLKTLPDESVHCCVTSPPYFNLRCYGHEAQIGREQTPQDFVSQLVGVFREVRRVLRDDGTLWLNLGDSYNGSGKVGNPEGSPYQMSKRQMEGGCSNPTKVEGLKPKDLIGIPWRVAFALQQDGWWLRSDIIWAKANCMPESVMDRPTRSHEYIFLLSKSERYYYDHEAIKEPCIWDVDGTGTAARKARASSQLKSFPTQERARIRNGGFKDAEKFNGKNSDKQSGHGRRHEGFNERWSEQEKEAPVGMRNKRDVWTVAPANYPGAHFATFPPALIEPCILAGCPEGGTILDPFGGSGTTAQVAIKHRRKAILCELNPEYIPLIHQRCEWEIYNIFSMFDEPTP